MHFLKSLSAKLSKALIVYGGWGLFLLSLFDSAGVSMPGVKDALLLYLSSQHPGRAWLYAVASGLGTVIGSAFVYMLGRGGASLVKSKPSPDKVGRARRWLEKNDFVTITVTSLFPPPLPVKPFLFAAGVLRMNVARLIGALVLGAAIRFGVEAWVGVRFGMAGEEFLHHNFAWILLIAIALIVIFVLVERAFERTPPAA